MDVNGVTTHATRYTYALIPPAPPPTPTPTPEANAPTMENTPVPTPTPTPLLTWQQKPTSSCS
jgi:hypothetical protein